MLSVNGGGNSDLSQKSLQITEDDKFYCRLLSKDTSLANPSFRVYYGVAAGAVPFQWEAQPGTPKHGPDTTAGTVLPPLTPPPSYQQHKELSSARNGRIGLGRKRSFRSILLTAVTPGKKSEGARDGYPQSTVPRSPSLSSCSSSVSAGSYVPLCRRRRFFNSSLSTTSSSVDTADFHAFYDDEDNSAGGDRPRTTLASKPVAVGCFGMARRSDGRAAGGSVGFQGCFRMVLVKRTLLSMVGHGNGPTTASDSRVSAA